MIINRPGASGAIAAQAGALAAPDGYTLNMAVSSNFVVAPEVGTKWPVDLATDFVTIGLISDQPMIIAVSPSLGVSTLPEFIAYAKGKPNEILYGGTRLSVPHLTGELLNQRAGIKMRFIPTTGGAARVIQDIMNGNLQAVTDSVPGIRNAIRSGAVKPLAFTGDKRLESFPDLPLASETLPGFHVKGWFALLAPAKTPPEIVSQIRADLRATLEDAGLRKRYEAIGTFPRPSSLAEAQAFIKKEQDLWRPIVRSTGRAIAMPNPIIVVGGGIAGLTLALSLHERGIPCRVFESAPSFRRLGVGINLLPHAIRELSRLGLQSSLAAYAVETREMSFYTQHGQFIFTEPRGRFAGYEYPQFSIHRGDFHKVLTEAVHERLGPEAIIMDHRCVGMEQDNDGIWVHFTDAAGQPRPSVRGPVALACDGIHSVIRRQLYPNEGPPSYQGINMWRGVSRWKPFLSGATMVQAGWLDVGKLVIYPISAPDAEGLQVINWVAEIQSPRHVMQDWNLAGRLEDFYPKYANWCFPWLDVAGLIRAHDAVLEFPMVDRDPLPSWTAGRVTLVGDAAHPMYPRGGNGAGQGILDARSLARHLGSSPDAPTALKAYEAERLPAANQVVLTNRTAPPDVILQVVHERSGGKPFERLEDLVSWEELAAITDSYKRVAGFDKASVNAKT